MLRNRGGGRVEGEALDAETQRRSAALRTRLGGHPPPG